MIHQLRPSVGVIGLGYVGLPLARAFAGCGSRVVGYDSDPIKVGKLCRGESYIRSVPAADVSSMLAAGFEPTDRPDRLGEPDALVLCLPTPLTVHREPDLAAVSASAAVVADHLRPGQLVVLASTTYPGTTRDVLLPILERSGLIAGRDFFVAYSPEREDPGNARHTVATTPRVVAGLDPVGRGRAAALFRMVASEVVEVSSPEVAEACKLLENTYRAVNIALVNELKVLYDRMGIDVWEVIAAAATKPFGFQPFYPGPGLGGHCIPIDPFYLSWMARKHGLATRFIELAGEVNTAMPAYVVGKVADALNAAGKPVNGSRVLVLGMAYKKDVDDPRESPGFELMDVLSRKGAVVSYHDPFIPVLPRTRKYPHLTGESVPLTPEVLSAADCVLIATDHTDVDYAAVVRHARLVVDTRNATRYVRDGRDKVWLG